MKTPKYCVYGDAVSYLTHLESTGPPLRIQISPDFKEKLNDIGGFETVLRGPVKVKVSASNFQLKPFSFNYYFICTVHLLLVTFILVWKKRFFMIFRVVA